jgi:hypothetical protein
LCVVGIDAVIVIGAKFSCPDSEVRTITPTRQIAGKWLI